MSSVKAPESQRTLGDTHITFFQLLVAFGNVVIWAVALFFLYLRFQERRHLPAGVGRRASKGGQLWRRPDPRQGIACREDVGKFLASIKEEEDEDAWEDWAEWDDKLGA